MAYFIFPKYLRSLEEFRKNPHVKIPPKSPCANFQSLGKFKNYFSSLSARPTLRPTRSLAQPALLAPLLSWAEATLAGPSSPCVGGVSAEVRFPFLFASSELVASLSSLCQVGPGCQLHLPPPPADHCRFFSSPPATLCRPASNLEMPGEVFTPRLDPPPPLISPLNPSLGRHAINGVKTITVGRFPLPRPGVPLPGHYKRVRSTPRPSPHSPRPQLLAFKSATSTPLSASSADCSPLSPGRVRPSATPSCSRWGSPPSPLPFPSTGVRFLTRGRHSGRSPVSFLRDGNRGPPWTGAARGPRVSFTKTIPGEF
jgi:hypothetical protein